MRRLLPIAACLLQACLFETHRPRTATLILAEGQASFDPLIALSLGAGGNILDTLYRGPGAPGAFRIPADGLSGSSRIRLEGYAGGRLAYRLEFPAQGDTLIAAPRWTPVGSLEGWPRPRIVSLAFPDGKSAFSHVGARVDSPRVATFDNVRWTEVEELPYVYDGRTLASDGTGLYLVSPGSLGLWKWNGTHWILLFEDPARAVPDVRFAMDEGVLTLVFTPFNLNAVIVERYQADSGWRRTESTVFPGHSLPYGDGESGSPNVAMDGGEPAILMSSPGFEPVVYRRRAGAWDTLPVGRPLLWPSLARDGDDLFLAFADGPGSGATGDFPIVAWRSEGMGWRSLGSHLFTDPGRECRIEVHEGRPFVLARVGGLPLVSRYSEQGWKTVVAPRFTGFPDFYDFALDGAGVPHLAVFDSEFRIVKFIDPYLP